MSAIDKIKNFMGFEGGDYEEDEREAQDNSSYEQSASRREPRIVANDRRVKNSGLAGPMQVVIVKPDHFDEVTTIADHINAHKSVVLNLESTDRDTCRRIIDFISGVTYANAGNIKQVSNGTFMITPDGVGISGEELMNDYNY